MPHLYVNFKRYRSYTWLKVEKPNIINTQPVSQVTEHKTVYNKRPIPQTHGQACYKQITDNNYLVLHCCPKCMKITNCKVMNTSFIKEDIEMAVHQAAVDKSDSNDFHIKRPHNQHMCIAADGEFTEENGEQREGKDKGLRDASA
eukprot:Gb_18053 [translate_table: standard]